MIPQTVIDAIKAKRQVDADSMNMHPESYYHGMREGAEIYQSILRENSRVDAHMAHVQALQAAHAKQAANPNIDVPKPGFLDGYMAALSCLPVSLEEEVKRLREALQEMVDVFNDAAVNPKYATEAITKAEAALNS